jgi:NAD(P)-dependent dehydrogenase (short-subunit alcohol dehydrogenase family)
MKNLFIYFILFSGYDDLNDKVGLALIGDVTKQTDVDNLGKSIQNLVIERNLSLWAVVNNAGIGNGAYIDWTPLEIYQKVMDVNYFGIIRVIKATLQQLKKTKYSRIINLSSIAGHIGGPLLGAYSGIK